jgi:hypothetical protein
MTTWQCRIKKVYYNCIFIRLKKLFMACYLGLKKLLRFSDEF